MQRVQDVLHRCAEKGITLHPGKFVLGPPKVSYLRVRTLREWVQSGRSPGQGPHPLSGAGRPHRHPIFLRTGLTTSVLLSSPGRVACPHPSLLVAEVGNLSEHVMRKTQASVRERTQVHGIEVQSRALRTRNDMLQVSISHVQRFLSNRNPAEEGIAT